MRRGDLAVAGLGVLIGWVVYCKIECGVHHIERHPSDHGAGQASSFAEATAGQGSLSSTMIALTLAQKLLCPQYLTHTNLQLWVIKHD